MHTVKSYPYHTKSIPNGASANIFKWPFYVICTDLASFEKIGSATALANLSKRPAGLKSFEIICWNDRRGANSSDLLDEQTWAKLSKFVITWTTCPSSLPSPPWWITVSSPVVLHNDFHQTTIKQILLPLFPCLDGSFMSSCTWKLVEQHGKERKNHTLLWIMIAWSDNDFFLIFFFHWLRDKVFQQMVGCCSCAVTLSSPLALQFSWW